MKKHKQGEPPPSPAASLKFLMALSTLMAPTTRSQRAAGKEDHVEDDEDGSEVDQDLSQDKDSSSGSMRARQPERRKMTQRFKRNTFGELKPDKNAETQHQLSLRNGFGGQQKLWRLRASAG